ncbi:7-carboxy-7-deazaguanine synthase QueE [Campylobacter mucosalis]|uniref:7-carboxy-7-deazaguanine synthase QueE n=1 Tax=Campylobacter mucosalis TaxID=202 RepID=UPI00146FF369|nr:7-carboxy-7-deazaguanine synthase QueE [Campylobacter mucosalis]
MLEVVESFLSIQGEGKFQGHLAIFIRLFGCNLNCFGFNVKQISPKTNEILTGCDTIRAVFKSHFSAKKYKNADEIMNLIYQKCENLGTKPIIVITGGEPLIHHKNEILLEVLERLIKQNFIVQFETNATIKVDFAKFGIYKKCIFAMSVKLENSGESRAKRIKTEAIKAISKNAKCFYKFVLRGDENELSQIDEILKIAQNEVWLMPMAADINELEKNALKVAQIAIAKGFCYSDRLHIRLWDKKEGV